MRKPIICIPASRMTNREGIVPVPIEYANHAYCAGVEAAGGIPMLIPVPEGEPQEIDCLLETADGVLLPGGVDVDPRFYGQAPLPVLGTIDSAMDRLWIHVLEFACERRLPVFGICRGLQLANVALGGTLYQDLTLRNKEHFLHVQRQNRDYLMHEVTIEAGSRLAALLGTEKIYTNTMHHQCVDRPGRGLRVTARTADGIPEAMESDDGLILLVQWHPEELLSSEPRMRALFADLTERAAGHLAD